MNTVDLSQYPSFNQYGTMVGQQLPFSNTIYPPPSPITNQYGTMVGQILPFFNEYPLLNQYGTMQGLINRNYEEFQYKLSGPNLNVNEIRNKLANYGITDVQENKVGNMTTITIRIQNPNEIQLQGIRNVIFPVKNFY
jgi:hypothetical protein